MSRTNNVSTAFGSGTRISRARGRIVKAITSVSGITPTTAEQMVKMRGDHVEVIVTKELATVVETTVLRTATLGVEVKLNGRGIAGAPKKGTPGIRGGQVAMQRVKIKTRPKLGGRVPETISSAP